MLTAEGFLITAEDWRFHWQVNGKMASYGLIIQIQGQRIQSKVVQIRPHVADSIFDICYLAWGEGKPRLCAHGPAVVFSLWMGQQTLEKYVHL